MACGSRPSYPRRWHRSFSARPRSRLMYTARSSGSGATLPRCASRSRVWPTTLCSPFQRQGMRLVENGVRNAEEVIETATFPIAGYDDKNVDEISARLEGLSAEQIRHLRIYEKAHKNRQSLIERFDSKLKGS